MEIAGSAALVTGGASGLGEATVRSLVGRGAVCTIFDRDAPRAESLAQELGAAFAVGDVTKEDDVAAAVSQAAAPARLRILVNCAGIGWAQRTVTREGAPHDLEAFTRVVAVNLVGTFNVLRLAAAEMARHDPIGEGERGVIVNTASIAAYDGQIGQIAYSASKGGIVGLTLPAARDLSAAGIRVNSIAPGMMDTPLLGQLPEDARAALGAEVPFPRRLGRPGEFARLVCAIIESDYLNGETIRLDGGLRMPPR